MAEGGRIRPERGGGMRRIIALMVVGATVLTLATAAPAAAASNAKVNVVHGIPGATVEVCVDGTSIKDPFTFGQKIVGAKLPAGPHTVKLVAAADTCADTAILTDTFDLDAGKNYTIVANLDAAGAANLKAFKNKMSEVPSGMARLTVRHTAKAPAVNVWANKEKLIGGTKFTWGKSETLNVMADSYKLFVTLPGSKTALIAAKLKAAAGKAYQVYAVGDPASVLLLVTFGIKVGTK
jgi:hypothetical protein